MNPVRLGFIGCGWWATVNHMPQFAGRPDVVMDGVCGLDPEVLAKAKAQFHFAAATTSIDELLARRPDAVVVSSPHSFHAAHAAAALEAGCHVLCEKPMALTAAEAWRLVDLAAARRRVLLVPYGWNFKPFTAVAKAWCNEGLLGQVEYALCHMASPTRDFFTGKGGVPASWAPTIAKPDLRTWQEAASGGGYAHGQLTHAAALLFHLTGLRVAEVSARMGRAANGCDLYDAATVTFAGGALGVMSGAATLPDDDRFQIDLRIHGSEGVLLLDVERERLVLRRHDGRHREHRITAGDGAYSCERPPHAFIELIRDGGANPGDGAIAARAVELCEALHRSAEASRPVTIAPHHLRSAAC